MWALRDGGLWKGKMLVMGEVADEVGVEMDEVGGGVFLKVKGGGAGRVEVGMGRPAGRRFAACYRGEPFWMKPMVGDFADVPVETQVMFVEMEGPGRVGLWVPLVRGRARCALEGGAEGKLKVVMETGDRGMAAEEGEVYVVVSEVGEGLRGLCARAARAVRGKMSASPGRNEEAVSHQRNACAPMVDRFGWCTWDAFYQEVSAEKVREGLESFRAGGAGGVMPGWMILDDGWQSEADYGEVKGRRLVGFEPNGKFGGDLRATIRMAKGEFGVEAFLVWHALQGYWGGVDGERMPGYEVREVRRDYSVGILRGMPEGNTKWWGASVGVVSEEKVGAFFSEYHALLKGQGVDGVKVDNQAALEGVSAGVGRVEMYRKYREGLEASVKEHFGGKVIHCMSWANDNLYHGAAAGGAGRELTRTSTDFWPKKPETHGLHVWTNALVSLWFGEFVWPDWDMFQSGLVGEGGERWGEFHAAARAISGGPVYVSDKPGEQDFGVLRKLVCADGSILRCDGPGVVSRESLFVDVMKGEGLLKVVNTNRDGAAGVIGVFHCHFGGGEIAGGVSAGEVEGMKVTETYVMYFHRQGEYKVVGREEKVEVRLRQGEYEVVTVAPIVDGVAVVGLLEKINGGAGVEAVEVSAEEVTMKARDAGMVGVWQEGKWLVMQVSAGDCAIAYEVEDPD